MCDPRYGGALLNADLIAHAREDIPYLLAELARVVEENQRLREWADGEYARRTDDLREADERRDP